MEEKINIAEILRHKPYGIKLYSPIFGECTFCCVHEDTNDICVKKHNGVKEFFDSKGLYYNTGEVMLFPSKEMRDWGKFFNKGDVLVCYEGKKPYYTIFDCFENNTYKDFNGKFAYDSYEDKWYQNEGNLSTNTFHKLSLADSEIYITKIEERFCGKLNLETLKIEKQPEFKDGDIVTIINGYEQRCILIFRNIIGDSLNRYCILTKRGLFTEGYSLIDKEDSLLFATEEEKNKLFSALEKEGKAWDSDKKQIVNLKLKVKLKPFDKVVVRCSKADKWSIDFFSYKVSNGYICTGDAWFGYCLPYNEETAKLIGTTDDYERMLI